MIYLKHLINVSQLKEAFNINSAIEKRVNDLVGKLTKFTGQNRHLEAVMALNDFLLQDAKNTNSLYFKAASPRKTELESSKRMLDQIKSKMKSGNAGSDAVMLNKRMIDTRQQLMDIAIKLYGKELGSKINSGF